MLCRRHASKKSYSPATAALEEKALVELTAASVMNKECHPSMISFMKRPCESPAGSFDLSSLVEASQPIEDSIFFPSIEWSNGIDSEEDAIEFIAPPATKRRCHGLVRSECITCSLSTLGVRLVKKNPSALCADSQTNEDRHPVLYYSTTRRKTIVPLAA